MNKFVVGPTGFEPKRSTIGSAAYDIKSPVDFVVPAHGKSELIDMDVAIQLDPDKVFLLFTRSGMGLRSGITLRNNTGVIDSDFFPNTIGTVLVNNSDIDFEVKRGDRIMQGIIMPYFVTDDDNTSGVRTGGFGSTGK